MVGKGHISASLHFGHLFDHGPSRQAVSASTAKSRRALNPSKQEGWQIHKFLKISGAQHKHFATSSSLWLFATTLPAHTSKMPKTPSAPQGGRRHNPLEDDITASGLLRNKPSKRKSRGADDSEANFVDSKASKNILRIGRELAEEDNVERGSNIIPAATIDNFGYDSRFDEAEDEHKTYGDDEAWGDDDEEVEEVEVDPEDLETYRKFMPDEEADDLLKHGWDQKPQGDYDDDEPVNLADLILQKIADHEAMQGRSEPMEAVDDYEIPEKVVEAYTK